MALKLVKILIINAVIIAVTLLLSPFLLILLIYRKYHQNSIIRNNHKRLKDGFNLLEKIKINGIQQWISVRGEKKDNPLLLILHGGPGASMMPYATTFQPLESKFTIIQWDQRGTGKTFGANKQSLLNDTISIKQMHHDTLEVVNYLRHRFGKEKLFVLGHSWGTVLGLNLAYEHPNLLHAYIGVCQFITTKTNEEIGYRETLKIAYDKNNKKAIRALEKINFNDDNLTLNDLRILRNWQFRLNGFGVKKTKLLSIFLRALSAPEYSLLDYVRQIRGFLFLKSQNTFFNEIMKFSMDSKTTFSTPIFLYAGKKDLITPEAPVFEYFQKIEAPSKKYIRFENSGHNLFFDGTEKFIQCVCEVTNLSLT